jgi:site-specific recombinase XerD
MPYPIAQPQVLPDTQLIPAPTAGFAQLWQAAIESDNEWMRRGWEKLILEWLDAKAAKSQSPHTRRNYQRVLNLWLDFVALQRTTDGRPLQPWLVDTGHVRSWQYSLAERGLSPVTVNHHLSCVSSFYSFVIDEKFMLNGVEWCLFADATGKPRSNPFKYGNIQRPKTTHYERAMPMPNEDLGLLIRHLEAKQHSLSGARNYALVLTYVLTGWRNHEVLRMQWKHLRPNKNQRGSFVFAWQGKGGKSNDEPLPSDAWHAIIHYLKLDGRWTPGLDATDQPIDPDEYIWRPVVEHTLSNLRNANGRNNTGHLSEKSALRIVRTALRRAGVKGWEKYRVHDLRHTFARLLLENGVKETQIMQMLHHSSLATTGLYTKAIRKRSEDPVDTLTPQLFQQMRAF